MIRAPACRAVPGPLAIGLAAALLCCAVPRASTAASFVVTSYGARGDGTSDDGAALQAAIDAAGASGGTVVFPPGTYVVGAKVRTPVSGYLNNTFLELRSGVTIAGSGPQTIVRVADGVQSQESEAPSGHVFQGVAVHDVTIRDLTIDLNGPRNLTPRGRIRNGHAIRVLNGGANVRVEKVTILNNPGHNDIAANGAGSGLVVQRCTLRNGGHFVTGPENVYNTDFSFIYSEWDHSEIKDNDLEQGDPDVALRHYTGGIELHGSDSVASGNKITGCDPGFWIASAPREVKNVVVTRNTVLRSVRGVAFWNDKRMSDVTVSGNAIALYRVAASPTVLAVGIQQPLGCTESYTGATANGSPVENLRVLDNTISSALPAGSTTLSRGMELHSVVGGRVAGNKIGGMTESGIALLGSPWGLSRLVIEENAIEGCGTAPGLSDFRRAGVLVVLDGSAQTPRRPYFLKDVAIRRNVFRNGAPAAAGRPGPMQAGVSTAATPRTAQLEGLVIEGNRFESLPQRVYGAKDDAVEALHPGMHFKP